MSHGVLISQSNFCFYVEIWKILKSMLPFLSSQNSQIPFKTARFIYHGASSLQLGVNWQKGNINQTMCSVFVCVCVYVCTWIYLGKWGTATGGVAIYVCGCILKVQCFDQKYFSHFEDRKFSLWFVAWALFGELAFRMYFCLLEWHWHYNIANYLVMA